MNSIFSSNKSNFNIYIYSLKQNILTVLFFLFFIYLILFSKSNLEAAKNGLILWYSAVVPSLFPFFVATELLTCTNIVPFLGKLLNPIMRPLFNVPGESAFALIMGLISGYPVGAKIVSSFIRNGTCTKEEAERMLAFTNNSGPLFVIGTVGVTLFGSTSIGILLFVIHIFSCITVGILFKFIYYKKSLITNKSFSNNILINSKKQFVNFSSLGDFWGKSITNSISTILMIGGFIVIFSVIISILNKSNILNILSNIFNPIFTIFNIPLKFVRPFLSGFIELTNGISLISNISSKNININIILCSFLLGFGGISVLLQVFSIVSKEKLSIKTYFIGKILQGVISCFYTFIALQLLPFFNLNL